MSIEVLLAILKDYGVSGLILVVLIYMLLKGQFSFRYPRSINGK
jgi:hypothetical protein